MGVERERAKSPRGRAGLGEICAKGSAEEKACSVWESSLGHQEKGEWTQHQDLCGAPWAEAEEGRRDQGSFPGVVCWVAFSQLDTGTCVVLDIILSTSSSIFFSSESFFLNACFTPPPFPFSRSFPLTATDLQEQNPMEVVGCPTGQIHSCQRPGSWQSLRKDARGPMETVTLNPSVNSNSTPTLPATLVLLVNLTGS